MKSAPPYPVVVHDVNSLSSKTTFVEGPSVTFTAVPFDITSSLADLSRIELTESDVKVEEALEEMDMREHSMIESDASSSPLSSDEKEGENELD